MKKSVDFIRKKYCAAFVLALILTLMGQVVSTQGIEQVEDMEINEDQGFDAVPIEFGITGYVEFESYISIYPDQELSDTIKKKEIRTRFDVWVGTDSIYLFATPDLYLDLSIFEDKAENDYDYQSDTQTATDMRFSSNSSEFIFRELYLNYSASSVRLRLGNQIYGWGTADTFNPTAYFNAYDLREFVFRGEDEFRSGSPSFSGMFFLEDVTLETVFSFAHNPMLLAVDGNFWALNTSSPFFSVIIDNTDERGMGFGRTGFGARLSTSLFHSDVSISGYHGPDKEPVFVPWAIALNPNEKVTVIVKQQHFLVSYMGLDFSKAVGDFVIQFEAAYSPDKSGLVVQNSDRPDQVHFPFEVKNSSYIAYAAGFNYFIPLHKLLNGHEGESVFTFDYSGSTYFDDDVLSPLLSNLVTLRYDDSFFDSRITASVTTVYHIQSNGSIIWPKIGYDFQNGLLLELSFAFIDGKPDNDEEVDPIFYYFRNNDLLMWKVRYEF